jgi:hypothetical protein
VATDSVDSGNGSKVGEAAPSPAPYLYTSITDIRQGLAGDEKYRGGSSPVVAEIIHVICDGQQRNGPMMTIPRVKEAQGSGD